MSIKSRAKGVMRPSPIGNRPRLRGAISKPVPFNVTDLAKQATDALAKSRSNKIRGAFGRLTQHAKWVKIKLEGAK